MPRFKLRTLALSLACTALFALSAQAQYAYKGAVGVKLGSPLAITGKYMFSDRSGLEALVTFGGFTAGLTALYEYHASFGNSSPGLRWYLGLGGHTAYTKLATWYNPYGPGVRRDGNYFTPNWTHGIDAVLGLEYLFRRIPFSIALDVSPVLNIYVPEVSLWWHGGISLRYTFN